MSRPNRFNYTPSLPHAEVDFSGQVMLPQTIYELKFNSIPLYTISPKNISHSQAMMVTKYVPACLIELLRMTPQHIRFAHSLADFQFPICRLSCYPELVEGLSKPCPWRMVRLRSPQGFSLSNHASTPSSLAPPATTVPEAERVGGPVWSGGCKVRARGHGPRGRGIKILSKSVYP